MPYAEKTKNYNLIELVSSKGVQMYPLLLKSSFLLGLSIPGIQMQETNSRQEW